MLPSAPDDVRGRRMGNYEVLCRLGTGGMAELFLATRRGLAGFHKPVVLKKILPDIQGQDEFVQMFLDEAKVTGAFNHPNIAQVFDLDVAGDELFLAMEFVPGATLLEVARACKAVNEPMPPGLSLAAVRDTALALHYAHTFADALGEPSPVIHRDVAEKNIMVTYEGVTKLLDFGIAKHLAGEQRTQVGRVKGTTGYMSPEQLRGEPLDARSDLFSLGVVLHECLTGMRLFPGKALAEVSKAVLRGPIVEPSRINKEIPPALDALVLKALARRREERHASALEFARELERVAGPLIWLPERSGELLRRLFAERREQTRQMMVRGRAMTGEVLAQALPERQTPPPPPPGVAGPRSATPPRPPPEPLTAPARPRSLSRADAIAALETPEEEDSDIQTAIIRPRRLTFEQPITADAPLPRHPPARAPQAPLMPPLSEEYEVPEYPTAPATRAPLASWSPPVEHQDEELQDEELQDYPTSPFIAPPSAARLRQVERREEEPQDDEVTTAPGASSLAPQPARPRWGLLVATLLLLFLLGAMALGVVLRLDGGLLSSRLFPPSPEAAAPAPAVQVAPAPAPAPAEVPAPAEQAQQVDTPGAPLEAAPPEPTTPTAEASPLPAAAATVESPPEVKAEAKTEALPPVEDTAVAAPTKSPEPELAVAPEPPPEPEPVVKKRGKVTTSRARPAAVGTGSAPEVVTNAEEANRAWQALERERTGEAEPLKGKGALTLATDSTAKVYLGSRSLGETPLFRVPLRPGKHTLRLVAPGTKPLKLQVEIKAGEVTSLSVPFGDKPAQE